MNPRSALVLIVLAQFFCTSLWFSGNTIVNHITGPHMGDFVAHFTSAVQLGFICGTLLFAVLSLADKYSPSKVFFISAIIASAFNTGLILSVTPKTLLAFRFFTGFFLAGIYPVGMKIASDYFQEGLGKSLGFLVGALVLGTALPHLVRILIADFNWHAVVLATSFLALAGGAIVFSLVPNGPFRKISTQFSFSHLKRGFESKPLRSAAFGYFGHMWELYTFWALVPTLLTEFNSHHQGLLNVSLWSFIIIGIGSLACVASGLLSRLYGEKRIATLALGASCTCCLLSPVLLQSNSAVVVITFLAVWSVVVIADSPLFSALVAKNAATEWRGTTLTIVTCIGFAITILSIQCLRLLAELLPFPMYLVFLAIGPLFGLASLATSEKKL